LSDSKKGPISEANEHFPGTMVQISMKGGVSRALWREAQHNGLFFYKNPREPAGDAYVEIMRLVDLTSEAKNWWMEP